MAEIIFLNGKFLSSKEARISVLEPGFLFGWGLFETMRSYKGRIVYFNQHLQRIKDSCKIIDLRFPYPLAQLKEVVRKAVEINGFKDSYVKLVLSKSEEGTDTIVIVKRYRPYPLRKYRLGFGACICRFRQNELSALAAVKTNNHLLYRLAYLEAKNKNFDETIILNNRGYITEASQSNIFLVKGNETFTPAIACGCLDGITRRVVFDIAKKRGIRIYEGNFTVQDLYQADEAFVTSSLKGVMPLVSIEKKPIGKGQVGRMTKSFVQQYNSLL